MKSLALVFCIIGCAVMSLPAQVKIGDNPNIINPNSLLELESGTKGFFASPNSFKNPVQRGSHDRHGARRHVDL